MTHPNRLQTAIKQQTTDRQANRRTDRRADIPTPDKHTIDTRQTQGGQGQDGHRTSTRRTHDSQTDSLDTHMPTQLTKDTIKQTSDCNQTADEQVNRQTKGYKDNQTYRHLASPRRTHDSHTADKRTTDKRRALEGHMREPDTLPKQTHGCI